MGVGCSVLGGSAKIINSIYSRHQLIHWFSGVMHGRWFAVCGRIADVDHGYQFVLFCIWEDFSEQGGVE